MKLWQSGVFNFSNDTASSLIIFRVFRVMIAAAPLYDGQLPPASSSRE